MILLLFNKDNWNSLDFQGWSCKIYKATSGKSLGVQVYANNSTAFGELSNFYYGTYSSSSLIQPVSEVSSASNWIRSNNPTVFKNPYVYGDTGQAFDGVITSNGFDMKISTLDTSGKFAYCPFLTDCPMQIDFINKDGTSVVYNDVKSTPYLANTYDELSNLSSTTINIVPGSSSKIGLNLIDETEGSTIFSISDLSVNYSDYSERLD